MPLTLPAADLDGIEGTAGLIVIIPQGTLATKNGGRPYKTRKPAVATVTTVTGGEVVWQTLSSDADFAASADRILIYDTEHRHHLRTSTAISGGSPIRGGGNYRKAKARCSCGWESHGNVHTAEVKEQWLAHLECVAQVCAWLTAEEPLELNVLLNWREEDPGTLTSWEQVLAYRAARPSHLRNFCLRSPHPGLTDDHGFVSTDGLPAYLLGDDTEQ